MQAITVKFLGPTNTRGARWKATCDARSLTVSQDYALNPMANAMRVAKLLAAKLAWAGTWYGGHLPNSNPHGYVFVHASSSEEFEIPK
jgi:hypothetical protein